MPEDKRHIIVNDNIVVGYNYIKQQFYITNKSTTIYSTEAEDIYKTLTGVFKITDVTLEQIQACKVTYEVIEDIYYTWQDNGAYIHSLQFNDFTDYPLIIDCENAKLYIKNSNVVFNLTLQELAKTRVQYLVNFYKETLGLAISIESMTAIYNLLLSYYKPTCYNQIAINEATNTLYYNNIFILSNYNKSSNIVYNGKRNPNNTLVEVLPKLAYIESTDTNTSTINLVEPLGEGYNIGVGSAIVVQGTGMEIADTSYNADGTYHVASISEDRKQIVVQETLPISYEFQYITCSLVYSSAEILAMLRDNNSIIVQGEAQNLLVGDTVQVKGANVVTECEVITSLNTSYTIQGIESKADTYKLDVINTTSNTLEFSQDSNLQLLKTGDTLTGQLSYDEVVQTQATNTYTYTIANTTSESSVYTLEFTEATNMEKLITGNTLEITTANSTQIQCTISTIDIATKKVTVTGIEASIFDNIQEGDTATTTLTETSTSIVPHINQSFTVIVTEVDLVNNTVTTSSTLPNNATGTMQYSKLYTTITTEENIATDFTGEGATLTKETTIGNISTIQGTTITLMEETDLHDMAGKKLIISNSSTMYTIQGVTDNKVIEVAEEPTPYNIEEEYPQVLYPEPSEEILITITSVQEELEPMFPRGEFLLDTFEEAQRYIESVAGATKIPNEILTNMYTEVPTTMEVQLGDKEYTMKFKGSGIYSKEYEEM